MPSAGVMASAVVISSAAVQPAFKTALGNNANVSSGTSLVITTTAAVAVDDLVVVRWAADNLNASTPTGSVTDSN